MIKEKKKQGAFCKRVVDLSPDDHRRVAFTVVAIFFAARTPLAALSLALDPLHLSAPQGRKRAPLPSP